MRNLKVHAFVIKKTSTDKKFSDVILFTKEFGKIQVKASGLQKITSKRSAYLEPCNQIVAEMYEVSEHHYILTSVSLICDNSIFKKEFETLKYIFLTLEIVSKILEWGDQNLEVYNEIENLFCNIHGYETTQVFTIFLSKVLSISGFMQDLRYCAECVEHFPENEDIYFDNEESSFLCGNCKKFQNVSVIKYNIVKLLYAYSNFEFEKVIRIKVKSSESQSLENFLLKLTTNVLGKKLESLNIF